MAEAAENRSDEIIQDVTLIEARMMGFVWKKEFRFHAVRKWRADFAHLPSRSMIEIGDGFRVNGRHKRGTGFAAEPLSRTTVSGRRLHIRVQCA